MSSPFFLVVFPRNSTETTLDYTQLIERKRLRLPELESFMAQDGFFDDPRAAGELTKEYNRLKSLLENWEALSKAKNDLAENTELAKSGDPEMA